LSGAIIYLVLGMIQNCSENLQRITLDLKSKKAQSA
jgi:hypothetical protein